MIVEQSGQLRRLKANNQMRTIIQTSQFRYRGEDRLDITSKTRDPFGQLFAPPWGLVQNYKSGYLPKQLYKERYQSLLERNLRDRSDDFDQLLKRERIVLVCFCPPGDFCHRLLAANFLQCLGAWYKGEIQPR